MGLKELPGQSWAKRTFGCGSGEVECRAEKESRPRFPKVHPAFSHGRILQLAGPGGTGAHPNAPLAGKETEARRRPGRVRRPALRDSPPGPAPAPLLCPGRGLPASSSASAANSSPPARLTRPGRNAFPEGERGRGGQRRGSAAPRRRCRGGRFLPGGGAGPPSLLLPPPRRRSRRRPPRPRPGRPRQPTGETEQEPRSSRPEPSAPGPGRRPEKVGSLGGGAGGGRGAPERRRTSGAQLGARPRVSGAGDVGAGWAAGAAAWVGAESCPGAGEEVRTGGRAPGVSRGPSCPSQARASRGRGAGPAPLRVGGSPAWALSRRGGGRRRTRASDRPPRTPAIHSEPCPTRGLGWVERTDPARRPGFRPRLRAPARAGEKARGGLPGTRRFRTLKDP